MAVWLFVLNSELLESETNKKVKINKDINLN